MRDSSKGIILSIALILSSAAFFYQWQWLKNWATNHYEYRSNLFIIIGENAPKKIAIYTNCFSGTDLKFNYGSSAIYVGAGKNNVFIQDNLAGLNIRVIDEKLVPKTSKDHLPDDVLYRNSKQVIKIESKDSTSFCGLYKSITLQ